MSKSLISEQFSQALNDNTTSYFSFVGSGLASTIESEVELPIRDGGVFSNLFAYVSANTTLVNTVITLRKSRADTAVTVTYASGETGIKEDTTHTDTFANTDEIDYAAVVANDASGSTTITLTCLGVQFAPTTTTDCVVSLGAVRNSADNSSSTTYYMLPSGGSLVFGGSEASSKYRVRTNFTSSNLFVNILTNARTTNTIIRTRKNGANGSQSITFSAGETGQKEDTSNTDTLVSGDDFNYSWSMGASSEIMNPGIISTRCVSTSNIFPMLKGASNASAIAFNTTTYSGVGGKSTVSTTEATTQIYPRFDFVAKELVSYVSANTIATSASTITLRDNGADSAVTVSYAAAETGLKNDSTNTAQITSATDEINYKIVTPNTSGNLTITWIGILGDASLVSTVSTVVQAIMF